MIAHPDDETFVSGTLSLCIDAGFALHIICITDGENGSKRLLRPGESTARLAKLRRAEMGLSAEVIGATTLAFLNYPDTPPNEWGNNTTWDLSELTRRLGDLIRSLNPEMILTHGPEGGYGHPAHKQAFHCVMAASDLVDFEGAVYSFCGQVKGAFFNRKFDQVSDVTVDVRSFLDRRATSLAYHQSQIGDFLRPWRLHGIRAKLATISALALPFTEWGYNRKPIPTTTKYFELYPIEGLVRQRRQSNNRIDFFAANFAGDRRVRRVDSSMSQ